MPSFTNGYIEPPKHTLSLNGKLLGRPPSKRIETPCLCCGKILLRREREIIRKQKQKQLGFYCSSECLSIFLSKKLTDRWDSGKMSIVGEKESKTKLLGWAAGKYTNWTAGKTKLTDSRISNSSKKISKTLMGKLVGSKNPFYGKHHTVVTKNILREKCIFRAQNGVAERKITKPEQALLSLIQQHKLPYRYTGTGAFWVENTNPDFTHSNNKTVIELQGCYWHNCPQCFPNGKGFIGNTQRDTYKQEVYQRNGIAVIYIWQHELKSALNKLL